MKTVKPRAIGLLTKVLEEPAGPTLVVSAMAFFRLDPAATLGSEVEMWKVAADVLGPDTPLDFAMPKPRGEVLLAARAYPAGGKARPACSVRVKLGTVDKTLYVVGDRQWRRGAATDPEPFTEMPITWANAFGGPELPQNPLGKGHKPVRDERGEHHPLPNIEDPKHIIGSPADKPTPVGFGPYDLTWPQRYSKIGTYDANWLEDRYPGFAADFDPGFFNSAPPDQQIEGFFRGDEPFTLENVHPDEPVIEGRLPGIKARVFLNFHKEEIALREVPMWAETVHLFPHVKRGIVIFRGVTKVADDDAGDVRHLLAAFETLGEPKPLDHYGTVLAQRLDRKTGHLYVLRDRDLMPPAIPATPEQPGSAEMKALIGNEGHLDANMRRGAERELAKAHEKASADMAAHGLTPPPKPVLPPPMKAPPLDELPALVSKVDEQLEQMHADAGQKFAEMEKMARAECAKHGVDYDKAVLEQRKKSGGPPKFSAKGQVRELEETLARLHARDIRSPDLEAKLADPSFLANLEKAEKMLRDGYRLFAHHMDPAARLEGDVAAKIRAEVIAARDAGESLFGRDLTGADLSHLDLRGADLRLCFLENANLEGANLEGADLSIAVLARANLTNATLQGAKLVQANLGSAVLTGADLSGKTDLTNAILAKADLWNANLAGATLEGADLGQAKFEQTDMRGVSAPELVFLKSDLRGVMLAGADLRRCTFVETALDGIDFTKARLDGAILVTITGEGCVFRGANLTGAQIVKDSALEGACFAGADLTRALLRATNLTGADFTDAVLTGADLSESDLTDASLEHAAARGALFVKTNFTRANLRRADLMDAILQRATLRGANLESANLFRADMLKADVDSGTVTKGANLKSIRFIQKRPHGER